MKPGFRVWNVEGGRPKSPQTLDLSLPCSLGVPVHAESPPWMKIMSQATCGEATRHARVSQGHTLDIQSGDGWLRGADGVRTALYRNAREVVKVRTW
jgi:hypothetical protein